METGLEGRPSASCAYADVEPDPLRPADVTISRGHQSRELAVRLRGRYPCRLSDRGRLWSGSLLIALPVVRTREGVPPGDRDRTECARLRARSRSARPSRAPFEGRGWHPRAGVSGDRSHTGQSRERYTPLQSRSLPGRECQCVTVLRWPRSRCPARSYSQ